MRIGTPVLEHLEGGRGRQLRTPQGKPHPVPRHRIDEPGRVTGQQQAGHAARRRVDGERAEALDARDTARAREPAGQQRIGPERLVRAAAPAWPRARGRLSRRRRWHAVRQRRHADVAMRPDVHLTECGSRPSTSSKYAPTAQRRGWRASRARPRCARKARVRTVGRDRHGGVDRKEPAAAARECRPVTRPPAGRGAATSTPCSTSTPAAAAASSRAASSVRRGSDRPTTASAVSACHTHARRACHDHARNGNACRRHHVEAEPLRGSPALQGSAYRRTACRAERARDRTGVRDTPALASTIPAMAPAGPPPQMSTSAMSAPGRLLQLTRPTTIALFFDPNPRQLQSAASICAGRP